MSEFGGKWTEEKLKIIKAYLDEYVKVTKQPSKNNPIKKPFHIWYVDAFSGKGYSEHGVNGAPLLGIDEEQMQLLAGSPLNALQVNPAFDEYLFIECNAEYAESLKARVNQNGLSCDNIRYKIGDANEVLNGYCQYIGKPENNLHRGVVFIDPFATQLHWKTVEALAKTKKLDVWILFPIMAINRMLPKNGDKMEPAWRARLEAVFGTSDWSAKFYRSPTADLFGDASQTVKQVQWDDVCSYYLDRHKMHLCGGRAEL